MYLVLDFDGTITRNDTIAVLAQAALDFHKERQGLDLGAKWRQVVQAYLHNYQTYKVDYETNESDRRSPAQELRFLAGLGNVEKASLARVKSSGVFSGLERHHLFQMGVDAVQRGDVVVRDGFGELLALAGQNGWEVSIISVNWSRAFIEGVLHPHSIKVLSNDISSDGTIEGPRSLGRQLTTSFDKAEALKNLAGNKGKMLYFGDSATDLECLLQGGVVISTDETSTLLQTLRRVGIQVPHVANPQNGADIVWAHDFREVLDSDFLHE